MASGSTASSRCQPCFLLSPGPKGLQRPVWNHRRVLNLWIDTDIGDDIDDAVALWVAARRRGVRLVGVSTVYGPVVGRMWLAAELLARLGERVPVLPGASRPLSREAPPVGPRSYLALVPPDILAAQEGDDGTRVSLIAEAMQAVSEPFHLLTIGAMTNAARLLRDHPAAAARWQGVTCMAGRLEGDPEYNIRCDPEAARLVLARARPRLVGLEASSETLPRGEVEALVPPDDPAGEFLLACYQAYRGDREQAPLTLFDPIALLSLVMPKAFYFQSLRVLVAPDGRLRLTDDGAEVEYATASDWHQLRPAIVRLLKQRSPAAHGGGSACCE